jgi:imidazolonepropionase-like amidohydrolase
VRHLTLLALAAAAPALGAQPSRTALEPGTLAITDVTVVPMTSDTALAGQTVIVRDGRITSIGPSARAVIPRGARRIDGRGRWLVPGFADMHVHLHSDDDAVADSVAPYELGVMLANGVTTARLMIGTPEHLVLRRELAAGRVRGPNLWVASPQFAGKPETNGKVVATPEQARAAVAEAKLAGYDFIKLTTDITRPVYEAIVDEARARRIGVVGHVDPQVGVDRAIEAGQQIEHLDNTFEAVRADSAPADIPVLSNYGIYRMSAWRALDHMDDRKVDALAGRIARAGVWTVPTLAVFNTAFAKGQTEAEVKARPDWAVSPPKWRDLYTRASTRYWSDSARMVRTDARRARFVAVRNRLVKAIVDSGGRVMTGSDTPEFFMTYGYTLHRELASLVEAGLTPYQALRAATANPAEYLGAERDWGTIATGRRADLVLLDGDPCASIANTSRIVGVSIGGRWLDGAEREHMIREAATRLASATSSADARP